MSLETVKALLLLAKLYSNQIDCKNCPLKPFCGKMPCEW